MPTRQPPNAPQPGPGGQTPEPTAPPIEKERGPQVPVELPGDPEPPQRVADTGR